MAPSTVGSCQLGGASLAVLGRKLGKRRRQNRIPKLQYTGILSYLSKMKIPNDLLEG